MPQTIKEVWESYNRRVLPSNVSNVQYTETRRAFYAGARGLLHMLLSGVHQEDNDEMLEADAVFLESIHNELERFLEDIKRGTA